MFQSFQDDTFTILEEFRLATGFKTEFNAIAKTLENHVLDEMDYKLDNYLEYELSVFWESATISISEYVLKRYQF